MPKSSRDFSITASTRISILELGDVVLLRLTNIKTR